MNLPPVLAPFRHGPFARYTSGAFISMLGTWMQVAAQGWVLTNLTAQPELLGWLNLLTMVPTLILTLLGGRVADRFDKRVVILFVLAAQTLTAASVGWLVACRQITIWQIFVSGIIVGTITAFEVPAVDGFVPELVPHEMISGAIAIDRSNFQVTRLIGPALGGYLIAVYGVATAYFLNAASFVALGLILLTVRAQFAAPRSADPQCKHGIGDALSFVRRDKPTLAMIGIMTSLTTFVSPFVIVTLPYYVRYVLHFDSRGLGDLMAATGVGALIGSLLLLWVPRCRRSFAFKATAIAIFIGACGMARASDFALAAGSLVSLTIGLSMTFGAASIILQERAPHEMRSRIAAIAAFSYFGALAVSGVLVTKAIAVYGMRSVLITGGTCYLLALFFLLTGRSRLTEA